MIKGWFIGDFEPSVLRNQGFEVAIKTYSAGDKEELHHHRLALEITAVVQGTIIMNNYIWEAGDIIVIEPGDSSAFEAKTNTIIVVIKTPSVIGDKYLG